MKINHYARKKRQLKNLSDQLGQQIRIRSGKNRDIISRLIERIRILLKELARVFSKTELRRIMGATALIFGLSAGNGANAQNFVAPVQNPFGLNPHINELALPAIADIDGDGDLDIFAGEYYGIISFYENTGSAEEASFAEPVINPFGLDSVLDYAAPQFGDLDNDGDLDLLVGEYEGSFQYFENTGDAENPQFADPEENPFGLVSVLYMAVLELVDLDDDGDLDILVNGYDGALFYMENTGTPELANFGSAQENPFGLASSLYFSAPACADLDGDGDFDLLVGEYYGNLKYFENTGDAENPQFADAVNLPFNLVAVYGASFPEFADMDDDGDVDLIVGDYYANFQYFENVPLVGKPGFVRSEMTIYPNPAVDLLEVSSVEEVDRIQVFNLDGMLLKERENTKQVSIGDLPAGTYFVHILTANETRIEKVIKQ